MILILCIIYILYAILGTLVKNSLLKRNGICLKGILIPESTSFSHRYTKASLVYEFTVNGKTYKGNSLEKDTSKIGDTICIVYLPSFPSISRPIIYFENGQVRCDCNKP